MALGFDFLGNNHGFWGILVCMLYSFLADLVVVAHAAYIGFVVLGLVIILLGGVLRWSWVRGFWFRVIHLATIGIVVAQALAGVICPLTSLENFLRAQAGESTYTGSFIGHWVHELIFFDLPFQAFTTVYCLFGAVVLATLFLIPPNWPWKKKKAAITSGE